MSLNNGFVNNTIICNERKSVDLDALNLLASGEAAVFCRCAYKNENKHHHFVYNTDGLISFTHLRAGLSFESAVDILSSAAKMIKFVLENNLVLDNVKNSKEYIFKQDHNYKYIYLPIYHKPHISIKDYLIRLLNAIHHKDVRITKFVKELRRTKDDNQSLACLNKFVSSYVFEGDFSNHINSLLSDESETSLLSAEMRVENIAENENPSDAMLDKQNEDLNVADHNSNYDVLDSDNEGETTVLSRVSYDAHQDINVDSTEGETTVLNRENCDDEKSELDVEAAEDGETTLLSHSQFDNALSETLSHDIGSARLTQYFTDESSESETTVLTSQPQFEAVSINHEIESDYFLYLVRNINGEEITVDVTPFTIGKDSVNNDYVLNNDSVSRSHATIIYEEGNYYIMDNGSTNGTMIEGIRLQPEEKGEIENNYIISLGNESFQAHIERR